MQNDQPTLRDNIIGFCGAIFILVWIGLAFYGGGH